MKAILALFSLLSSSVLATRPPADSAAGDVLLKFSDNADPVWHTIEEKNHLAVKHVHFVDVTAHWDGRAGRLAKVNATQAAVPAAFPPISQQEIVNSHISKLSVQSLQNFVTRRTNWHNRNFNTTDGVHAALQLQHELAVTAWDSGHRDITFKLFNHSENAIIPFSQPSVIASFPGTDPTAARVIFGAHIDTISDDPDMLQPGADDNASGTAVLMEVFRVLVQNGFKPRAQLDFHFYAGEEYGLLGSGDIAASYADAGTPVRAMVQFDMTAFTPPGQTHAITFISDFTKAELNAYLSSLVKQYCSIGVATSKCVYGCSDHYSWTSHGYPAAFPFETDFSQLNPYIHTAKDTVDVDGFSFDLVLEFTKLAVAAAIELSA